ncbi:glycosyltransferase family 2 protein [Bacillus sp. YZJH907-2]|uniref:Glycosyltransferase family 2 protein n=2 Tax=Halalkalibacter suaedae TaxID=2822140 RepID=A0A940WSE0_9BACI|nr:glycosyltransferase family 2 protein [Bacillus suaedae]
MSWLARLQMWDYLISIAAVKRQQSLYEGTLVAQGAFSAYLKEAIEKAGGWFPVVGEDIVLTWGILKHNYRVDYQAKAVGFTHVPVKYAGYFKQRKRWARGLFEAFRAHPTILIEYRGLSKFIIFLNLFFPLIDLMIMFVLLPGILVALFFQFYLIAGVITLLLIPLALLNVLQMYQYQQRILGEIGISVSKGFVSLILFLVLYSFIQAPICIVGYAEELFSMKKR